MTTLELFIWAISGGIIVAMLSAIAVFYNKEQPNVKHLSRDFILGATMTGFLYPLIPESFDDMKVALSTAGSGLTDKVTAAVVSASTASLGADPGVQVGPANF
jgi:hypothetical protein